LPLTVDYDDGVHYQYSYDPAGRVAAIPGVWQATALDAAGRTLDEQFGNGVLGHVERDTLGLAKRIRVTASGGNVIYDVTATRTSFGAVATALDGDGVGLHHDAAFLYDTAGRLTDATIGTGATAYHFSYAYDSLQNMASRAGSGPSTLRGIYGSYHYGEAGAGPRQLTSITNGASTTTLRYDAAGRQTAQTGTAAKTFAYNALDQLVG